MIQIVYGKRTPDWLLRLKLAYRSAVGTWKYTKGVKMQGGDTLNIHHRFFIVSRYYD